MPAIYHMCPEEMQGEILYPLNTLAKLYPDVYQRESAKYLDHPSRYELPRLKVPKLDCLWSDVVFCLPMHPYLVYKELQVRGIAVRPEKTFFQLSLEAIQNMPTAIYHDAIERKISEEIPEDMVEWFLPQIYRELEAVPTGTLAWFDELARRGRRGAIFAGIPHVLVHGPVSVKQAQIIRWGEPPM